MYSVWIFHYAFIKKAYTRKKMKKMFNEAVGNAAFGCFVVVTVFFFYTSI